MYINLPKSLKLVIKCELLSALYISLTEKSYPELSIHSPLLSLRIRITGMVDESRYIAFESCIDDCVTFQRHKVVVKVVLIGICLSSFVELLVVQDFPNILQQEFPSGKEDFACYFTF